MKLQSKSFIRLSIIALLICISSIECVKFKYNDEIPVWITKLGPFNNPSETYNYFSLPFCRANNNKDITKKQLDVGEVLKGDKIFRSDIDFFFEVPVAETIICKQVLNEETSLIFNDLVQQQYWYKLYVDNLPVFGMIGSAIDKTIYTHKSFEVLYNKNKIIQVDLTSERPVEIKANAELSFSYSVSWKKSDIEHSNRFDRYLDHDFFEHQIHWFSIFNSIMMVLFLCGLIVLVLLRTVKNAYVRVDYDNNDVNKLYDDEEYSSYKKIANDVFRAPRYLALHCAFFGIGLNLLTTAILTLLYSIVFKLYSKPDDILHAAVFIYAFSNFISGFSSAKLYSKYKFNKKQTKWINVLLLAWGIFPVYILSIIFVLNCVAMQHGANVAVSLKGLFFILILMIIICFPTSFLGTLVARNFSKNKERGFPVRVNLVPRPIPQHKSYLSALPLSLLSGWLPFASVFIEAYFVLASVWNYKYYYAYGFTFIVLIILIIVVACVSVFAVYLRLSNENYKWQWIGFFGGSSVGFYLLCYCSYYFNFKTDMTGTVQTTFYFGYTLMFCCTISLICGAIGIVSSLFFVNRIYKNIHVD